MGGGKTAIQTAIPTLKNNSNENENLKLIEKLNQTIKSLKSELSGRDKDLSNYKKKISAQLEEKDLNVKKYEKKYNECKRELNESKDRIEQLEEQNDLNYSKVKKYNNKMNYYQNEASEWKEKMEKFKAKYKNLKNEVEKNKIISSSSSNEKIEVLDHTKYEIKASEVLLLDKIGSGGYGECYSSKWIDSGGDVDVVVKSIEFKGIKVTSKKVFEEIKVQLNIRNPSICRIFGYSLPTPQKVYIIMEKMDFDLNKMLKEKKFTIEEKLKIMEKMTQCVQVIHSQNILHRDLKCANFLADKSGNIKLTDFGMATVMIHSQSFINSDKQGTLPWMDPDLVIEDDEIGKKVKYCKETDIYSLGCCFFEVLFEKNPFVMIFKKKFEKLIQNKRNEIPKNAIEIMKNCVQEDKYERPTASELLKLLKKCQKK